MIAKKHNTGGVTEFDTKIAEDEGQLGSTRNIKMHLNSV
jgi:hypothetical protein